MGATVPMDTCACNKRYVRAKASGAGGVKEHARGAAAGPRKISVWLAWAAPPATSAQLRHRVVEHVVHLTRAAAAVQAWQILGAGSIEP